MGVKRYVISVKSEDGENIREITFPHDPGFVKAYIHALSIIEEKNHDYSDEQDPFANFRECEKLGVDTELGVALRMSDKFARLRNYFRKGLLKTRNEGVLDALVDIMNYSAILYALLSKKEK